MARRAKKAPTADQILDQALLMAEDEGWGNLRLRRIAEQLGCQLTDIQKHYRDQDAVADAWFGRAWEAMLAPVEAGFFEKPVPERLHTLMMRWFDALAPHRKVTAEMLSGKLYVGHPHHWVPMIFNLSRTIQWLREAAKLDAGGRQRQMEEIGLTGLFLITLSYWCRDKSENQERTRDFLRRALKRSDRSLVLRRIFRRLRS